MVSQSARSCLQSQYLDEIDLGKGLVVAGLLDIKNGNDVLVVEVSKQLHLSQCSQAEHGMVEWRNLLDGHLLARGLVQRGAAAWLTTSP